MVVSTKSIIKEEVKMKKTVLAVVVLVIVAFVGSALAVPPGKTVEFAGGSAGKVVFDGKIHADKGLKCNDCHTKIFPMKKGGTYKMADMNAGKACGECHNGTKAFKTSDAANCAKCHKK
jgi:c(7)-type cytochrome triheme protein